MTIAQTHPEPFDEREFRDSMHLIERQRARRLLLAVAALIGALIVGLTATYLMYSDQPASAPPATQMR